MLVSHNNLSNYYYLIFNLVQHHKYSVTELEDMIPFERDIYLSMLESYISDQNKRIQEG